MVHVAAFVIDVPVMTITLTGDAPMPHYVDFEQPLRWNEMPEKGEDW